MYPGAVDGIDNGMIAEDIDAFCKKESKGHGKNKAPFRKRCFSLGKRYNVGSFQNKEENPEQDKCRQKEVVHVCGKELFRLGYTGSQQMFIQKYDAADGNMKSAGTEQKVADDAGAVMMRISRGLWGNQPVNTEKGKTLQSHAEKS